MRTFLTVLLSLWLLPLTHRARAQDLNQRALPAETAQQQARRQEILRQAPVVFVGREVEYNEYKENNRLYSTTLIQVFQVLRGEQRLRPGFVELLSPSFTTDPAEVDRFENNDLNPPLTREEGEVWGVYFCTLAQYPHANSPYRTDNPQPLELFQRDQDATIRAAITSNPSEHGWFTGGLGRGFAGEAEVQAFLAKVPGLKPISEAAINYTPRPFVDMRPKVQAQRTAQKAAARAAEAAAEERERAREEPALAALPAAPPPAPEEADSPAFGPPVTPTSLPAAVMPQLASIMQRLQTRQPLSKQDSAFLQRYAPQLLPAAATVPPRALPRK